MRGWWVYVSFGFLSLVQGKLKWTPSQGQFFSWIKVYFCLFFIVLFTLPSWQLLFSAVLFSAHLESPFYWKYTLAHCPIYGVHYILHIYYLKQNTFHITWQKIYWAISLSLKTNQLLMLVVKQFFVISTPLLKNENMAHLWLIVDTP